ncbi:MAG: hypothetical protein HYY01_14910 [Chloroflexi bacterium]|nr:hypothetical protein [Chloroflexota bacterium]
MVTSRESQARLMLEVSPDQYLRGAIDLHYHSYPDMGLGVRMRVEDVQALEGARDMGMRGLVIKSHLWPTTGQAYQLRQRVPGIEVWGSMTLDVTAGGLNPWALEMGVAQGAKVVWMPTWSSANDLSKANSFSAYMKVWFPTMKEYPVTPAAAVDSGGQLLPQAKAVIRLCKELGVVLSTGHLSVTECLLVAAEAEKVGLDRLIFGHPFSAGIGATREHMVEMARRGAYLELTALNAFGEGDTMKLMAEIAAEVGADRCVVSTDCFRNWPPPPAEFLRMFIARLLYLGISGDDMRIMVQDNPAKLLGLPPIVSPS